MASAENFPGAGATEKMAENSEKDLKTALFSLYLLYLYHA